MVRVTELKLIDRMLLLGPPGIGKTEVIRWLAEKEAEKLGRRFLDLGSQEAEIEEAIREPEKYYVFLRVVTPTIFPDELTYPIKRDGFVDLLPFKKLFLLTLPEVRGVLFLDEITNVQTEPQIAMLFSLIQEKEFSWGLKLAPGVKIIAAGNTPEWSEVVRALPKPLRARLTLIHVDPPTVDEWAEYMERVYGERWEKLTYAYLKLNTDDFIKTPADDWENFPCPRNWTSLALLLQELRETGADPELVEEAVIGRLGKEVGVKFAAFFRENITPEELRQIAKNPDTFFALSTSKKILIVYALSSAPIDELLTQHDSLIKAIAQRDMELFVLFLRLMPRKRRIEYAAKRQDLVASVADALKHLLAP